MFYLYNNYNNNKTNEHKMEVLLQKDRVKGSI